MTDKPARQRGNEMGATGELVARNLRGMRAWKGLSLRGLSELMDGQGHPISASSLQKIEAGVRRVDVDDLVALASALGVPPIDILTRWW